MKFYSGLELDGSSPYLFLDFDGVFNAVNRELTYVGENPLTELSMIFRNPKDWVVETFEVNGDTHYVPDREAKAELNGKTFTIQWSEEMVDEMNSIIGLGIVRPILLSTWKEVGAKTVMPLIGLNLKPGDWLDFHYSGMNPYEAGKYLALYNLYAGLAREGSPTPPFVWVDDVATHYFCNVDNPENTILQDEFGVSECLIVKPKTRQGISREEMSRIKSFVMGL